VKRRELRRAKGRRCVGRGRVNGHGSARAQGGVRAPSSGRHGQRESARGGRGTGVERPPDPTKSTYRGKAPWIITSWRPSRVVSHGGLGGSLPPGKNRTDSRRRADGRTDGERRQGCQRFGRERRRGKKTPTPGTDGEPSPTPIGAHEDGKRPSPIHRSGSGVVKHSGPWSSRAEPRLHEAPTR